MSESLPQSVEEFIRYFVLQTPEHAILILDTNLQVVWANPGAAKVFAQPADQLLGMEFPQIFTERDQRLGVPQHEVNSATSCSSADDDRWQSRPDGSLFWASGTLLALNDDDGKVVAYCKILRNRTDGKEHQEYLRNQLRSLKESNRRKDLFLATVSHELRNPLSPLSAAAELLKTYADEDPELLQPVGTILRQVDAMQRLIGDLMDVARIDTGKVHLETETLDLRDLLRQATDSLRPRAQQKGQDVQLLLLRKPVYVRGDARRLQQVFINLIENAVKYTPDGGKVWIKLNSEGAEAIARIEDTGTGIDPEMRSTIFDMFTQATGPQQKLGLGIGLALVKELVDLHGGTVQALSDGVGQGAEFIVRLPMVHIADPGPGKDCQEVAL